MKPSALLIDLDGVLRVWDPAWPPTVERKYGLPTGSLAATAFEWSRLRPALTGEVSHASWMAGVASALDAPDAVAEWQTYRGEVDQDALDLIRSVRAAGRPVALVTNATDQLPVDLATLGLADEFDAVVNSSVIGVHKPAPAFFAAACAAVNTPRDRCLFVDDEHRCVLGARAAGLSAYRWTGPDHLRYLRAVFEV